MLAPADVDAGLLTAVDRELLRAIDQCADDDGSARSLFRVAVVQAGLNYWWSLYRLRQLEALGYVRVDRRGPGLALVMRLEVQCYRVHARFECARCELDCPLAHR